MDDFLHNLRSGKLKQSDRGRRDYTDYKGPQRRAGSERRRTDYYAKVTNENFALIKESLDLLADTQQRIADAMAVRASNEGRIADALETICTLLGKRPGEANLPVADRPTQAATAGSDDATGTPHGSEPAADPADGPSADSATMLEMIRNLREAGYSWEKIARQFDAQNIPTVSGKGKWRGPAVKKYWEVHA